MNNSTFIEQRLALLDGVKFSAADLESITKDIEDNQRIIVELEEFARETPWISQQVQPSESKV